MPFRGKYCIMMNFYYQVLPVFLNLFPFFQSEIRFIQKKYSRATLLVSRTFRVILQGFENREQCHPLIILSFLDSSLQDALLSF